MSLSLSFSILFGSVHFSLECLSSQAPLCSGLPLLNTNKTRTTQVEQGARARRDKRLTRRSVTTAVNCPLLTLGRLLGTAAWPGPCDPCCPPRGGMANAGGSLDTGCCCGRDLAGIRDLMSAFHSPARPCGPRGPRGLLENGGFAAGGCDPPS